MKVCIAEKPSVARSIAEVLGATAGGGSSQGYWEGNGYQVTWTFGHLCELKAPGEYDEKWRRWSLIWLPILPARFGITLKDDDGVRRQFDVIQRLYASAECIINCGDAGQEGELIQRWVMQKAGALQREATIPIYRLWVNSMTDEAIREGFAHLELQQKYDLLYYAGMSRAIGDWLLGMNATRLFTLRYRSADKQVISIGRVQTPTLAMIVKRQLEITQFQPQQYWELKTVYREATFNATRGRYDKKEEAEAALAAITGSAFAITDVQQKSGKEMPKRLYDLTSLQVDCNRKFGFSADQTLQLIQSLYEKKVTTYPRVDTTYLPDDVYPKCPNILKRLRGYEAFTAPLFQTGKPLPKSKLFFDNKKVTDHHAIIPTGEVPMSLPPMEQQVFDLICRRFIASFYPECLFNTTTVLGEAGGVPFKATGKVITRPGWRALYAGQPNEDDNVSDDNALLPVFTVGEQGPHTPSLAEKWTKPPKFYTEATLLLAMETAGKQCEDETLREVMKENGIGRPSTRAAIIETLFKRGYIRKEKKTLYATQTGIDVIALIHDDLLKSPELTGQWERKLRMIERGEYSSQVFINELRDLVTALVQQVITDGSARQVAASPASPTMPPVTETKTAAKTTSAAPRAVKAAAPTATRRTRKKTAASAPEPSLFAAEPPARCPLCGGEVIKGHTAYGCANWRTGCQWRLPFSASEP